ncbi:uncharacterized protein A4U43_C09F990 [Asparagus officinalis]|uniref:Uncharacterized protein n=1 Tax=Asparagus officinalis TaxID=4686 RepID=A0A5P1E7N5_ASPOF|nr:uncharacterized protein A4U43_C09F990 [Asparagus officinalis]
MPRFPATLIGSKNLQKPEKVLTDTSCKTWTISTTSHRAMKCFNGENLFDDRHWGGAKSLSPIFVYNGDESEIELFAENTGFMFDIAPYFLRLFLFSLRNMSRD